MSATAASASPPPHGISYLLHAAGPDNSNAGRESAGIDTDDNIRGESR